MENTLARQEISLELARLRGEAARTQLLAVASRPAWNIRGDALSTVAGHTNGPSLAFYWDDDEDEDGDDDSSDLYEVTAEGVAIINVCGILMDSEPTWWMRYLGYASTPQIAEAVTAAGEDYRVGSILLYVDSPGGQVSGLKAACDAVWAVREAGEKPIWGACKQACSAAYEIVSQCQRVYLASDSMGGCLGTLILMADWSGYYGQMGVTMLRIASDGAETYKGGGVRGTQITEPIQEDEKRICNEYRAIFNEVIMRGRGFDAKTMLALADGRVHVGANAQALNLVDGIYTPEAVLAAMGSGADLDTPPADTPPDEDDEPSDKKQPSQTATAQPGQRSQVQEGRNLKTSPLNTGHQNTVTAKPPSTGLIEQFTNFVNSLGGDRTEAQPAPAASQEQHPVLTAALNAGFDTHEKFNALVAEHKELKDAKQTAETQALANAKTEALACATTAFGAGSKELENASKLIEVQASAAVLGSMTSAYKSATPKPLRPGQSRQTASQKVITGDETGDTGTGTAAQDAVDAGLNPTNVYAARAAK